MENDRCPKCGASVRSGAQWCTLCYADLRAPVPVPAAVPQAAATATATAPAPAAAPPTTPYAVPPAPAGLSAVPGLLGGSQDLASAYDELLALSGAGAQPAPLAPAPSALDAPAGQPAETEPAAAQWPCTRCRQLNVFEVTVCYACGTPFGAGLASAPPSYDRHQVLMWAIGIAAVVVLLVGLLSFLGTHADPVTVPPAPGEVTTVG
jgi:hypothetical protein